MEFQEVYEKYYPIVYKYLIKLTKDEVLAEEYAQETFFKALKNIKKYDPDKNMLTWLCTIAKNLFYTDVQKNKRYTEIEDNMESDEESVADMLIAKEASGEILKVLHKMEEPYKEVFTLRVFGEVSFKQIGDLFEKTESWARVTYYRAKVKIKEELEYEM